jgi:hypothetical protein
MAFALLVSIALEWVKFVRQRAMEKLPAPLG